MEYLEKFREVDREKIVKIAKDSLWKKEGRKALDYLTEVRCLSENVIERFNFGYCPEDIDHQLNGRIITPIYDPYNNLIAISTRHIDKERKNRFWHESFDKGLHIYGLNNAKSDIMKYDKAILVEGEIDVCVLHSYGFFMTVGVCGSAFTLFQAALLSRYCSTVFVAFDGDVSGKKSIQRTMNLYKKYKFAAYQMKYIPVFLPKDKDPDEYIRENGKQGFANLLKKSREELEKL
jgi:DNA primase